MSRATRTAAAAGILLLASCDNRQAFHTPELTTARMLEQPRANAYTPSAAFSDGKAMRTPPPGTIPRGAISITSEPPATTLELLGVGRRRFEVLCAACHGVAGNADTVVAQKMEHRPPPSLHEARIRALTRERVRQVIVDGYGLMPSYAAMLSADEPWAVADYVRALQLSQHAPVADLPPVVRAQLEGVTR